ncbi:hypothetical protein AB4K20DRAFT_1867457 [Rhizopus microsporus]|uniref:Uncharacterized protein n=1 Tax=Rhizopus microsporus TaxID=58291 RepID=A0A1X0RZF7_RHIZD|nr:hypothetical protein BCV71DRAFT_235957 [Rhizopus microsporus]
MPHGYIQPSMLLFVLSYLTLHAGILHNVTSLPATVSNLAAVDAPATKRSYTQVPEPIERMPEPSPVKFPVYRHLIKDATSYHIVILYVFMVQMSANITNICPDPFNPFGSV